MYTHDGLMRHAVLSITSESKQSQKAKACEIADLLVLLLHSYDRLLMSASSLSNLS
jgi:hypothetical protein